MRPLAQGIDTLKRMSKFSFAKCFFFNVAKHWLSNTGVSNHKIPQYTHWCYLLALYNIRCTSTDAFCNVPRGFLLSPTHACKQFHVGRSKFLPPNVFLWPIYDPVRRIKLGKLHLSHLYFSNAATFGTPSHCIHPDSLCEMQLALLLLTSTAVQAVSTTYQFAVRVPPDPRQMECLSSLKELDDYNVLIDSFRIAVSWMVPTQGLSW